MLEQINLKDAKIVEIIDFEDDTKDAFWVLIHGSMIDYTIDEKTGAVVDGSKEDESFEELWRFKRERHGWVLDEIDQKVSIVDLVSFASKVEVAARQDGGEQQARDDRKQVA